MQCYGEKIVIVVDKVAQTNSRTNADKIVPRKLGCSRFSIQHLLKLVDSLVGQKVGV